MPSWSVWINLDAIGPSVGPKTLGAEAPRTQAAIDLRCPSAGLAVRKIKDEAFRVEGCGHMATYVGAQVIGRTDREPSHPGETVMVELRRFFLVSEAGYVEQAMRLLDGQVATLGLVTQSGEPIVAREQVRPTVLPWLELSVAAERDLPCPRASIQLEVVRNPRSPSTFIAEGCGVRGLFVQNSTGALVITSRVALSPAASAR